MKTSTFESRRRSRWIGCCRSDAVFLLTPHQLPGKIPFCCVAFTPIPERFQEKVEMPVLFVYQQQT